MLGDLTVITGSMFSGKSTALVQAGRDFTDMGAKVIFCRPDIDVRYSTNEVVTHDGDKVGAVTLPNYYVLFEASKWVELMTADVILIDEGQFFNNSLITNVQHLLNKGKTVIVAGLDLDYRAEPFGVMAQLMAIADEVIKLHARCERCGSDARHSAKISGGYDRIELGSDDIYTPLCRNCYKEDTEQ